jgi:D-aminoacyl-tRNA deacylase
LRALLQRASRARVSVDGQVVGSIGRGWVILLGVGPTDNPDIACALADKVAHLRCFRDDEGKMNRSALDVHAEILVVSQFTLYADTTRGRRPSFVAAASPDVADPLVTCFVDELRRMGLAVETGRFGAEMLVSIDNDGPVTIWLDSDEKAVRTGAS